MLIFNFIQHLCIFFCQSLQSIYHIQYQICLFHKLLCFIHTNLFYYIIRFTNTGSIHNFQWNSVEIDIFFNHITGCTRNIGYNGTFLTKQSVQQAGFTHIWFAGNNYTEPITNDFPFLRILQYRCNLLFQICYTALIFFRGQTLNIIIGIIDICLNKCHQLQKICTQFFYHAGKAALQLRQCQIHTAFCFCLHNIHNRFCLCQIQTAIQKCSFTKFTLLCQTCTAR